MSSAPWVGFAKVGDLEQACRVVLQFVGAPPWEEQFKFHTERRWRIDFAWPELKIAIEVEGGTWISGRHTRGAGFEKDVEKYNALALAGWRLFRVTRNMLVAGDPVVEIVSSFAPLSR